MQYYSIRKHFNRDSMERIIIFLAAIILIYLLISLYFTNHFFYHTVINGVDVSFKQYETADRSLRNHVKGYKLQLIERDGDIEVIGGVDIDLSYNDRIGISQVYREQEAFGWWSSLFRVQEYNLKDLYRYDDKKLEQIIDNLICCHEAVIEPHNVDFTYSDGRYEPVEEIYGNKLIKANLCRAIQASIAQGRTILDLNKNLCYVNPKYTLSSEKTQRTKRLLDHYVATSITYTFGDAVEVLNGDTIQRWLRVDDNLDVVLSKPAVKKFISELSHKYDTVGTVRKFKTNAGTLIEVAGGYYGWKIDQEAEFAALIKSIQAGEKLKREPIYLQRALYRGEDEIGDTYIEINITKQHLWYYKDGSVLVQGPVVTGNPNRGYATPLGIYMINYKQKDAKLVGPGYEAGVTYWMPFNGNIGLHDASWRYSFGKDIYKRRGSHGCVNAPVYVAKMIFEYLEVGTPVICYEEPQKALQSIEQLPVH